MNKETMKRIRMAQNYQKKAIRALFPVEMNGHLEVIEGEMKAMFMEMVMEAAASYKDATWDVEQEADDEMEETQKPFHSRTEKNKNHAGAKKVNIQ